MNPKYAKQYASVHAQSSVEDASPHKLIQMLLQGAMDRVVQAKGCMERKDMAQKGTLISKAVAIIGELLDSLDMEKGGELAANLQRLYEYMCRQLLQANIKNDPALLDEVLGLLREVKEGWDGIADAPEAKPA